MNAHGIHSGTDWRVPQAELISLVFKPLETALSSMVETSHMGLLSTWNAASLTGISCKYKLHTKCQRLCTKKECKIFFLLIICSNDNFGYTVLNKIY